MKYLQKLASVLALFIGVITVMAGSKVLLGIDTKMYTVLNWLVVYNVIFGALSIAVSYLIWKGNSFTKKAVVFILSAHMLMAFYLYFFNDSVALESIKAMSFRTGIWIIILLLTFKTYTK